MDQLLELSMFSLFPLSCILNAYTSVAMMLKATQFLSPTMNKQETPYSTMGLANVRYNIETISLNYVS